MTLHKQITDFLQARIPEGYKVTWIVPQSATTGDESMKQRIIVEQTGDSVNDFSHTIMLGIDVYASTILRAENLAYKVSSILKNAYHELDNIISVDILSIYNNPRLDIKTPRYTVNVSVQATNN